ncbi:acyl-CoA dehydrogenase family protein [Roseibium sp. RKSG952]|uniref:acyl-CoA dehydrogenase family protein n=1 Tax=Roseibium sp. RKSG952 TaxID=2529384 RepID=UPI0012BC4293|nr:acyl-CoA dehydrogenase family protein [Roseibium sp. RKSG952]MTI00425.1 pimeloyl-CoA dehydrogenase large subunit [Roseibium sp. RKSG952]
MDLRYTAEEEAFRTEVREFLAENLPDDLAAKGRNGVKLTKAEMEGWHAKLQSRNWLAVTWPVDYGGSGWTAVQRHIFEEECALANAPKVVPFGVGMLGPVLLKFGTEEQKQEILPRILNGADWWCQGYSEPGAGSDLASLKTRAVREGEDYVINGQKTWTTLGQHANRIFCLVRTSTEGKPQEGISFVLIDMDTPGVELRPIRLLEGGYEVNEIFLTDVRVPVSNLVGEENKGWTIAKYLLTHERTNIAGVGNSTKDLEKLRTLAQHMVRNGKPLAQDPVFMSEVAEVEIDLEAMRVLNLRALSAAKDGAAPGRESSMLKIKGTVIRQRIQSLTRSALGAAAAPFPASDLPENARTVPEDAADAAADYFNHRKLSIFGGSNEIQRNIIAKDLFGA